MILPAYPLMHYYFFSSGIHFVSSSEQNNYTNGDHTKTGDMAYLSALLKSANDNSSTNKKSQDPPPSTNNEVNNLMYLITGDFHMSVLSPGIPLHFNIFSESVLDRYLKVLIPPPDSQA